MRMYCWLKYHKVLIVKCFILFVWVAPETFYLDPRGNAVVNWCRISTCCSAVIGWYQYCWCCVVTSCKVQTLCNKDKPIVSLIRMAMSCAYHNVRFLDRHLFRSLKFIITTVFLYTRLFKWKHSRKRFQNFRQSFCRLYLCGNTWWKNVF